MQTKSANIFLLLSTLFLTAFSQTISILSPTPDAEITAGQDVTLQLAFGNSLTGVQHVSVVIAILDCAALGETCPTLDAGSTLGVPLFSGNYTPEFHEQNLTVTIPQTLTAGTNMLTVAHFMLIGAGATPILQFDNVTVSTVSPSTDESEDDKSTGTSGLCVRDYLATRDSSCCTAIIRWIQNSCCT
ncbi:hypothetical protein BT96DRAFT_1039203 [Gymnopus androsaceus JB14]|uniref:Cohesin domain-containing protein n=1 Tax=Gymnopus androsaceus JB14 TaxID=1447944 RepID=A0A6A4HE14_9AGAR|nr:hypothetical protein BT96DRAFT_1039203 [Gymnopus androsaceus JB14]